MADNRFWCSQCKKEFKANEVEKRAVDSMFGEGRWWFCLTCGSRLIRYPDIGPREQAMITRVRQSIAQLKGNGNKLSPEAACRLLLDIGALYHDNGSYREACQVLYHTRELAKKNDLLEVAASANTQFKLLTTKFSLSDLKVVSLSHLYEQFLDYYIPH